MEVDLTKPAIDAILLWPQAVAGGLQSMKFGMEVHDAKDVIPLRYDSMGECSISGLWLGLCKVN